MKKIFGIMLSLLIALELCGMSIYAIENSYTDTKNHWAESFINRWSEYGIVQGSNGEFEPDGQLTCAQLATILTRLLKLPAAPDAGFIDNPSNAWYYDAINRCTAAGILKGNGDGTVTPNAPISRERAMVMLSRALGIEPLDSTNLSEFSDATLVSPYAQGYIAALIEAGIVGGVTADRLAPQENITRAATVTVLDRAISIYANENGKEIDASNAAGIILIAAENVKVINAPSGVSVIVAEGVDHAIVNGVSVAGGSSYIVKEKESKPVSGGSGGSTSGGSSSGGDVPSPSYAISNLHFEQSGDDYVLAWNGTGRDSFYYNVYLKLTEDSDWSYKGVTQDAKFKMDMLHSSKGVKVEAYINESDETPAAVAENLSLEVNVTQAKSELDTLSAIFTKEKNQYTAAFANLLANKFTVVLLQAGDIVDTYGQIADKTGNVSFLIPSDENDLIENGTYTIYSYDNYVLNGNQLSYTVYQHCEPTPCLTTNPYIRNIHLEKNGNAYEWVWGGYGQENIDYYKTYVRYGDASDWTVRTNPTRLNCALVDIETSGSGFRVEAYSNEDKSTPLASVEIPGIKYLVTNVKAETTGIVADFTKSYLGYTVDLTGLPAETFTAINYVSSGRSGWDWGRTDSQGSVSLFIKSGDENGLFENGTYTVYSYDNYVLNGNQLSYTVYQHCEPTGCIEDIPEIGNATLDIYSFAAKADIDNVTNKIGAIHFDRPYTVNLEDGADISEWFSGIPDGLRILYKKGNSSSNKILFEIRGTPTNTVTNGIHYLRCVIPSNTIFVDGQPYPLKIQPNIFCSQIYVCDSFEYINSVRSWIEWDKVEKSDDIEDVIESLCEALCSTENTTTDAVRSYDDNTIYLTINVSTDRGYKFSEDVDIDLSCYSGFQYKFSTLTTLEGEEKPYKTEMDFGIDVEIDRDKLAEIISD